MAAGLMLWAQAPPTDRVGYPKDYRETFVRIRISDRADSKTTAIIYANAAAATIHPGEAGPYPYGSVLVNEAWSTVKDGAGNVVLDESGHYELDKLEKVHVMRKERGFGEAYAGSRSGNGSMCLSRRTARPTSRLPINPPHARNVISSRPLSGTGFSGDTRSTSS